MLFGSIKGLTGLGDGARHIHRRRVDSDGRRRVRESVLNDAVAVVLYRAIQVLEDAFTLRNVLRAVWAFAVVPG